MAWRIVAAVLGLLAVSAGCTFQDEKLKGQGVACEVGKEPCPSGSTCRAALGRCVDDALLALPAATPVGAALTPALGNAHATFALDFQVTRPLARPPTAVALGFPPATFPFACDACGADLRCHCTWSVDAAHPPPQGAVPVEVSLLDEAGNAPAPVAVGAVTFDSVAPSLVAPPSVALQAPVGALAPVSRLGNGVQAEVCFVVSEPLRAAPQVWAGAEDAGLAFAPALGTPQGQRWCFGATLDGRVAAADGPLQVHARVADLADNEAVLALAGPDGGALLDVDRTPPAPPDLSEATGLRYHRAPWGELPAIGTPRLELRSGGSTLDAPATVIAYADQAASAELGRASLSAGEAIVVPLSGDPPEVWVQRVDAAGNTLAGGPVRVRNVDWVLNLGRKVAGDAQSNPHDCYARAQAGATLLQPDDRRTALDEATGPTGGDGGAHLVGAGSWRQRHSTLADAPDLFYAFDPARGVLTDIDAEGATASFDGLDWSAPPWPVQPGLRNLTGLTFDRARGKVVLFGGQPVGFNAPPPECDVWELGTDGWRHVPCAHTPAEPAARTNPVVGYDPVRRWTVVMAGYDAQLRALDDAWAWDGARWTALPPPPPGCPDRGLTWAENIAGGGAFVGFTTLADGTHGTCVGRWSGAGYTWTQPIPSFGPDRVPSVVTIDPATSQPVALVLATPAGQPQAAELWRWSGADPSGWRLAGTLPVAADLAAGGPLFGLAPLAWPGRGPSLQVLETTLDQSDHLACTVEPFGCTPLAGQGGFQRPPGFLYGQLAFDARGQGLMQGAPFSFSILTDFQNWRWDHGNWSPDFAAPLLFGAGVGTPEGSLETWLYGGALPGYPVDAGLSQDLWVGFSDGGWKRTGSDPTYDSYGLPWLVNVPDAGLPGLVAAGWGGPTMWLHKVGAGLQATALNDGGPQGYFAYDPLRGVGVLTDFSGVLWEASPPTFRFHTVSTLPLVDPLLVFDEGAGALLALGGAPSVGVAPAGVVKRWDGSNLLEVPIADPDDDGDPEALQLRAAAWDRTTRRTRQVIGAPALGGTSTWELALSDARPALVCQFRFAAAQAPAAQPLRVDITATARGLGPSLTGAALSLWRQGAWREAGRCTTSPCTLHALVDDADQVASLLADLRTLGVAVAPLEDNGRALAVVDVDTLQATLTYRLP